MQKCLKTETKKKDSCNCRNKSECPLKGGNCRQKNVVNKAKLKTNSDNLHWIKCNKIKTEYQFIELQ